MSHEGIIKSVIRAAVSSIIAGLIVMFLSFSARAAVYTDPVRIELFPNPATELLSVQLSEPGTMEIKVFSIIGNQMRISPIQDSPFKYTINISDLPSGYYLLMVKPIGENAQTIKFEKK